MSVAPPVPQLQDNPYMDMLKPNTNTATESTTLFGTSSPKTAPAPAVVAPVAPAAPVTTQPTYTAPTSPTPTLNDAQRQSITNLVNSGRAFTETDARNYAYATGAPDYTQFVGKTGAQITGAGVGTQGGTTNNGASSTQPNPSNPEGMSDADLAAAAGRAGLSIDDYIAAVGMKNPATNESSMEIRNRLGIPGLVDKAFGQPTQTTVDAYKEMYSLSGLDEVKNKIKEIDDSINKKRQDLATATGELLNNPWLSQASRTGRLRILNQLAQADIENSINARQQYLDQYDKGVSQIEEAIKRKVYDTGQEKDLNTDKLNYLLNEAERQDKIAAGEAKAKNLRYLPDFLKAKGDTGKQYGSGPIGEYQFYADQELKAGRTPMDFNEYQNADANRKIQIARNGAGANLTTEQFADAARKGYTSDQQLSLYEKIVAGGGQAPTLKAPTEAQGAALGFYDRTRTANDQLTSLQGEFNGILARGGVLPNFLKSDNRQLFEQSEANFINSVLRRESGAAISPAEFASARRQYIPQPGDSQAVLAQKEQNRLSVIGSLKAQAGALAEDQPGGKPTIESFYKANPEKRTQIEALMRQGKSDEDIAQMLGFNQPLSTGQNRSLALAQAEKKYPEGSKGGQCGIFAHKIVEFPPIGDAKSEKFASVDKFGIPAAKWRQSPQVGDVIITDESKRYGHVAVINSILPNGTIQLTESNFRGKESVSHDRTLPINSPKIYGAFRGKLKA
jgi:hypothetical protein